jgi:hypothetical protein
MFTTSRSRGIAGAVVCAAFVAGCAPEPSAEVTAEVEALRIRHTRDYHFVRGAEYHGQSTNASGSARWYMPTVVEDQDGDGMNELLLGQPYGVGTDATRQGAVRILSGDDLSELAVFDPDEVDPEYAGTFGYAAHSLGDINYDGHTDFAIGSAVIRLRNPDGTLGPSDNRGVTYLLKSTDDGSFEVTRIFGENPAGFFGYWFADVTFRLPRILRHGPPGRWRGLIDLPTLGIVSSAPSFRAGRAWGIEPRHGTVEYVASDDPANNDAISERRGYYIAPTGDIDGNGITDFLMTANGQWAGTDPDPRVYAGRVYFHDGLTGDLIRAVEGAHENQFLGYRSGASQIDDVNRDGVDDFVVGSGRDGVVSGLASAGVAYVISGRAVRSSDERVLRIADHPEIVLRTHAGDHAGELFGDAAVNLFDMNADGVDEYAISGMGEVTDLGATGGVTVFDGRTGDVLHTIAGESVGLFFGQQLLADPENGVLYVVDPYFLEGGRSVGRVTIFRAEPSP